MPRQIGCQNVGQCRLMRVNGAGYTHENQSVWNAVTAWLAESAENKFFVWFFVL